MVKPDTDTLYDAVHDRPAKVVEPRCPYIVTKKTGKTCGRSLNEDETVCVLHGASITRSKDTIQRRMLSLQEKAIAMHEKIMTESYDDKTQLAAVALVYECTGLRKNHVVLEERQEDLTSMTDEELLRDLDALKTAAATALSRRRMNEAPVTIPPSASDTRH